jgi:hypothetical protein
MPAVDVRTLVEVPYLYLTTHQRKRCKAHFHVRNSLVYPPEQTGGRCGRDRRELEIAPVNLVESAPPKVSSPFVTDAELVGSNETPISSELIVPENTLVYLH